MKTLQDKFIIGVDHGYGNMKTANHCFRTGILSYDTEPLFTGDMLIYNGRYYLIGEGHKEFIADKIRDEDYYLLTLVAIAKELKDAGLTEANIILAADLPLTWTSGQKKEFAAYLGKNTEVVFNYKKIDYHITISVVTNNTFLSAVRFHAADHIVALVTTTFDSGMLTISKAILSGVARC